MRSGVVIFEDEVNIRDSLELLMPLLKDGLNNIDYNSDLRYLIRNSMRTTVNVIWLESDLLDVNKNLTGLINKELKELKN